MASDTPTPLLSARSITFSVDQNAWQCLVSAAVALVGGYIATRFFVAPEYVEISEGHRRAWLVPLLQSGDGWPGVAFGLFVFGMFAWWSVRAGWRFFTSGSAIEIHQGGIRLHPSYGRGSYIPVTQLAGIEVFPEVKVGIFGTIHSLRLRWMGPEHARPREVKVRSNTVIGGKKALDAFAGALEAELAQRGT